jgi:hypothetical protein
VRQALLIAMLSIAAVACGDDASADGSSDGGGAGSGASPQPGEIDACAIVTQQDASELFGQPAVPEQGTPVVDPALIGECLWTYEVEDEIGSVSSQLLQFYVWEGEMYHSVPEPSEPFAVGQDGYLVVSDLSGVDIGWIQDGNAIALSYFSIGDNMPTHASRVEPMKALALEVSDRL